MDSVPVNIKLQFISVSGSCIFSIYQFSRVARRVIVSLHFAHHSHESHDHAPLSSSQLHSAQNYQLFNEQSQLSVLRSAMWLADYPRTPPSTAPTKPPQSLEYDISNDLFAPSTPVQTEKMAGATHSWLLLSLLLYCICMTMTMAPTLLKCWYCLLVMMMQ